MNVEVKNYAVRKYIKILLTLILLLIIYISSEAEDELSLVNYKGDKETIVLIPGEKRILNVSMVSTWGLREKVSDKLIRDYMKVAPEGMKVGTFRGSDFYIDWDPPLSMQGNSVYFGRYHIKIATLKRIRHKIEKNVISFPDSDCFKKLDPFNIIVSSHDTLRQEDFHFYKVTSNLKRKDRIISGFNPPLSCIFTSNFDFDRDNYYLNFLGSQHGADLFAANTAYTYRRASHGSFFENSITMNWSPITSYGVSTGHRDSNLYYISKGEFTK